MATHYEKIRRGGGESVGNPSVNSGTRSMAKLLIEEPTNCTIKMYNLNIDADIEELTYSKLKGWFGNGDHSGFIRSKWVGEAPIWGELSRRSYWSTCLQASGDPERRRIHHFYRKLPMLKNHIAWNRKKHEAHEEDRKMRI